MSEQINAVLLLTGTPSLYANDTIAKSFLCSTIGSSNIFPHASIQITWFCFNSLIDLFIFKCTIYRYVFKGVKGKAKCTVFLSYLAYLGCVISTSFPDSFPFNEMSECKKKRRKSNLKQLFLLQFRRILGVENLAYLGECGFINLAMAMSPVG